MTKTIWKTIKIGDKQKALKELKKHYVSDYAQEMIKKIEFSTEEKEVELVKITLSDWFDYNPTTKEIYDRAEQEGLELCPAEIGVYLRNEYTDQPIVEWLTIGMQPISTGGEPRLFYLDTDGDDLGLRDFWGYPGLQWFANLRFVFSLRKSSELGNSELSDTLPLELIINGVTYIQK